MKIKIMTKDGTHEKELSKAEVKDYANRGYSEAKKEILKDDIKAASSIQAEVDAIKKFLGV